MWRSRSSTPCRGALATSVASSTRTPTRRSSTPPAASPSPPSSSTTPGSRAARSSSPAPATPWTSGAPRGGRRSTPSSPRGPASSPNRLTTLLDMTRAHVPVLADELVAMLDPRPGQVVVDCTLGAAGHARLVANRLGATGELIAIDRDPLAERAFAELSADVPCARFIRADFAAGLQSLLDEGVRVDAVYLDLGMSSM